ncbi:MAG TPA: immunoglobulin domain-containing protein [Verrucomicrobiota bacterium]|nr:immunoglobulin domain-containing protein [Verrucomicrobiota bacterium]HNT14355.1 immunoglobulin domain-containing protein [Verrucomicrobiota bacterium]
MKQSSLLSALGFTALALATAGAQGLKLENVWSLQPGDRDYLGTSTTERGLAYNPVTDHVLIVHRANPVVVAVLDAATGSDLSTLDTSGVVNPGTFALSKIGVAADGAIYAANFGTIGSSTPAFTVYRWADESSGCTIAYAGDPGAGDIQQWGTTFAVRGAGAATQILVSSSAGTIAALLTTTDGVNFTAQKLATDVMPGQMGIAIAFGANNTFWAKSVNGPLVHLGFDTNAGTATTLQAYSITNFPGTVGPFNVDVANHRLVGINITTPDTVNLYDIANLAVPPALLSSVGLPLDYNNNLFMGAVDFGGSLVFTLDSNNGVQAYSLSPSSDPIPPSMILEPQDTTVYAGDKATLVASATGTPPLTYQWQLNGMDIPGATGPVLTIANARQEDEGTYLVLVSNSAGTTYSLAAYLTVLPSGIMSPIWSLAPGSRPYLTASGNNQRGMAYNPVTGHLVLVNRAGGLSVNLIDGATGADRGTLSVAGISGGTFPLLMVGVAADGVIYAANFGSLPNTTTTLYRWANETAQPTIAFQGDPMQGTANRQWGNTIAVRGAGTNTQILLPTGGQEFVAVFTTTDGSSFSPTIISNVPTGAIVEGAAFGAGDTFWGQSNAGGTLAHYAFDWTTGEATVLAAYDWNNFDANVKPIAVDAEHHLLAGVAIASPDTVNLYDISQVDETTPPVLLHSVVTPTDNANTLYRGALAFGADTLFALDTNNGIIALALPFLRIQPLGDKLEVSWAMAHGGYTLETRNDPASGAWTAVSTGTLSNGRYRVQVTPTGAPQYFRLQRAAP